MESRIEKIVNPEQPEPKAKFLRKRLIHGLIIAGMGLYLLFGLYLNKQCRENVDKIKNEIYSIYESQYFLQKH